MKNAIVPAAYEKASKEFVTAWPEYYRSDKIVTECFLTMLQALESSGHTRTAALNKIARDHEDLKGFSVRSLAKQIPDDMKNPTKQSAGSTPKENRQSPAAKPAADNKRIIEIQATHDPDLDNLIKENIQKESTIADLKKQLEMAVKESVPGHIELPTRLDIKKFLGLMMETNRRWQVRPLYMLLKIENGEVVDMELEGKALEVRA